MDATRRGRAIARVLALMVVAGAFALNASRDRPAVTIRILRNLEYDRDVYRTQSDLVAIRLVSGGFGALVIEGVPNSESILNGGEASIVVNLEPGHYLVYAVVPGHRAVGQEATLIVERE